MENTISLLKIPVSIGELFDKFSILEIKLEKILNVNKREKINTEINELKNYIDKYQISIELYMELKNINLRLWEIEDKLRIKESKKEFDDDFISLARSVYFTNDKRSDKKREINRLFNSHIEEVKEYIDY